MSASKKNRRKKTRGLARWHRWLGITCALILLLLSITGAILNHSEDLNLADSGISWSWLHDWYGLNVQAPTQGHSAGGRWFVSTQGQLWMNEVPVADVPATPSVSARPIQYGFAVAGPDWLVLLTEDGELIEQLDARRLPGRIQWLGHSGNLILLVTAQGSWQADAYELVWQPATTIEAEIDWPQTLPGDLRERLNHALRSRALTWEKLVMDLHAGRILGKAGQWIMDVVALLFCLLALSGLWLWWRRR